MSDENSKNEIITKTWYRKKNENISLDINLPIIDGKCELRCSALVTIYKTYNKDLLLSFDSKSFVESFLSRPETFLKHRIWYIDKSDDNEAILQLGNLRCKIPYNDAVALAQIVDNARKEILDRALIIEKQWQTLNFDPLGSGLYRLMDIPYGLWLLFLKFANEYDFQKGNSDWHIFNSQAYQISTINRSHFSVGENNQCVLEAHFPRETLVGNNERDRVSICWSSQNYYRNFNYDTPDTLNALMSYNWLTKKFLPKVLEWNENQNKKWFLHFFSKNEFNLDKFSWQADGYSQLSMPRTDDIKTWINATSALQLFFHMRPHSNFPDKIFLFTKEALLSLLNIYDISDSIKKYIAGNLNAWKNDADVSELVIGYTKRAIETNELSGVSLDFLLRCVFIILDQEKQKTKKSTTLCHALNPLREVFEYCDSEIYRERISVSLP